MPRFNVEMKRTVKTLVTVECETIEQARENPWDYATDEMEMDQIDYVVLDVTEQ
jgi:hypothetical protein